MQFQEKQYKWDFKLFTTINRRIDKLAGRQFSEQANIQAELNNAGDEISEQRFITKASVEPENDSA